MELTFNHFRVLIYLWMFGVDWPVANGSENLKKYPRELTQLVDEGFVRTGTIANAPEPITCSTLTQKGYDSIFQNLGRAFTVCYSSSWTQMVPKLIEQTPLESLPELLTHKNPYFRKKALQRYERLTAGDVND